MQITRREFMMRASACVGYALGAAAFTAGVQRFALINAYAQETSGYRALVCVFLAGGNDANNMVIPTGTTDYNLYSTARSAAGLAIARDTLLPISPTSITSTFGLHPNLADLHTLWTQQKMSVVCNVGPLVQPLTRSEYQGGAPRPYQLFSHSDQIAQWQTAVSDRVGSTGWGGRLADRFPQHPSGLPTITSLGGGVFTRGPSSSPLAISPAPTALNQVLVLNGFGTAADEVARRNMLNYLTTIDTSHALVGGASRVTQQGVQIGQIFANDVTLSTTFPNTTLGNQLLQVAKVIKFNATSPSLGLSRQIFFCQLGGFDTHQNQLGSQNTLFTQMSQAIKAFHSATIELGVEQNVTTFTLSDFGRTLQPAGSGAGVVGSDHAWGSHHMVVGGAVHGGDFYGVTGPNGTVFPQLQLGGPSDTDTRGRWIPTVSVEQYAATLAQWYGVSAGDIPTVFPNIGRFSTPNLGFMF